MKEAAAAAAAREAVTAQLTHNVFRLLSKEADEKGFFTFERPRCESGFRGKRSFQRV